MEGSKKKKKGKKSKQPHYMLSMSETISFIHNLLISKEDLYLLSDFLDDFKRELGYSLPNYGHDSVANFLRALGSPIQVILLDGNVYLNIHDQPPYIARKILYGTDCPNNVTPRGRRPENPSSSRNRPGPSRENLEEEDNAYGPVARNCGEGHRFGYCVFKGIRDISDLCVKCAEIFSEANQISWIDRCLSVILLDDSDIPTINLRQEVQTCCYVDVMVPEVRNPHRFILQLKKYHKDVSELMGLMLQFYEAKGFKYIAPTYQFLKNQVCAVQYNTNPECKEWYRAKIIEYGEEESTVYLIDFGITTQINNNDLRFLNRHFGSLPAQALNGHLSNVKPLEGKYFSEDCCQRLLNFVIDEPLVAEVVKFDPYTRWMSVILMYPNGLTFRINDSLVKGKFPLPDCDFFPEEVYAPVFYDSIHEKEYVQPEEIKRTRKPRAVIPVVVEPEPEPVQRAVPLPEYYSGMKKLFGMDEDEDEEGEEDEDTEKKE